MPQGSNSGKSYQNRADVSSRVKFTKEAPEKSQRVKSCESNSVSQMTNSSLGSRFLSRENDGYILAPDMKLEPGDQKCSFELSDGGKMVKINRKNGETVYMLRCVDGRSVYIEKTDVGACLIMTNQKGKITKSLAAQY